MTVIVHVNQIKCRRFCSQLIGNITRVLDLDGRGRVFEAPESSRWGSKTRPQPPDTQLSDDSTCTISGIINSSNSGNFADEFMRLVWLTDIHLNFVGSELIERLLDNVDAEEPCAVLISGDIGESQNVERYLAQFAARLACPVYFVLGNHDFYHGSVPVVREAIGQFCRGHSNLSYLTQRREPVELSPRIGLIGHDGWADARFGDYVGSDVFLSDYALIKELAGHYDLDRRPALQQLGDESAAHIRGLLPTALARYEHVILVTHVPPLREACWHEGQVSDDNWVPHFACKAMGDVILEIMSQHPARKLTVLCGHTHGSGETRPLANVEVLTGGAVYGAPAITRIFDFA